MSHIRHTVVFEFVSVIGVPGVIAWGARKLPSEVEQKYEKYFWLDDGNSRQESLSLLDGEEGADANEAESGRPDEPDEIEVDDGHGDELDETGAAFDPGSYVSDLVQPTTSNKFQKRIHRRRRRRKTMLAVMRFIASTLLWVFVADVVAGAISCSYYSGYTDWKSVGSFTFGLWLAIFGIGLLMGAVFAGIGQRFERLARKAREGRRK